MEEDKKPLWKTSQVCKMAGVTRRTLQEYEKFGLLKPTETINRIDIRTNEEKRQQNYYDEVAISKLCLIQIFVEAGYNRKTIKDLLESPTLNLSDEVDHLINKMEEKRKRIDGFINMLKFGEKI